jgi:hypothetical protein
MTLHDAFSYAGQRVRAHTMALQGKRVMERHVRHGAFAGIEREGVKQ